MNIYYQSEPIVADPATITYRNSVSNVLRKQGALELNQQEVKQLADVLQDALNRLPWDRVVFTRAQELAGEALPKDSSTGNLEGSRGYSRQLPINLSRN